MGYTGWGREVGVVVGGSRFPLVRPLFRWTVSLPQGKILFEIVFLGIWHTKYLGQRTLFPTLKPRCFHTCAVASYDEDSSSSDWCGLQLKHVTRPEWPGSCRKESVRGAERGLGPDEWPDCKQYKHISYRNDKWEYVFKLKSLSLKIYNIHGKFFFSVRKCKIYAPWAQIFSMIEIKVRCINDVSICMKCVCRSLTSWKEERTTRYLKPTAIKSLRGCCVKRLEKE